MTRKRTKRLTLVLLGSAGLMASGCGDKAVAPPPVDDHPAARLDEVTAKRTVAAGTASAASDAFLHASAILAAGPQHGLVAPLDLARVAHLTDQAVETYDVGINRAQLPPGKSPSGGDYQPRSQYHYHRGPGIGWFLFGYMMARSFSGPSPYVPPGRYSPTPRPVNPSYGNRSHIPSGGGAGRAPSSGGGSVSRGGFGGSGGGHASGGSS